MGLLVSHETKPSPYSCAACPWQLGTPKKMSGGQLADLYIFSLFLSHFLILSPPPLSSCVMGKTKKLFFTPLCNMFVIFRCPVGCCLSAAGITDLNISVLPTFMNVAVQFLVILK